MNQWDGSQRAVKTWVENFEETSSALKNKKTKKRNGSRSTAFW